MGLFNLFRRSKIEDEQVGSQENDSISNKEAIFEGKRDLSQILIKLNVNPLQYNHEEMDSSEISLAGELKGEIKCSDLTLEENDDDEMRYTYICLTDFINGKKDLYLSFILRDERHLKGLVDEFSIELGEGFLGKKEFTHTDLMEIRNEMKGDLRVWYEEEYQIQISFSKVKKSDNPRVIVYVIEK